MKKIIIILITITLFIGCKKSDPITPVTSTINNNTQSFTYIYELDGVPMTSVYNSSSIMNNQMSLSGFNDTDIANAIAVVLRVKNPIVGTYNLIDTSYLTSGSNDLNISLIIPNNTGASGSDYFYSNMTGTLIGNNNAQITITEIDYTNKVVSGTFNGRVVWNYDTTEIHEITNGVFTDVPFIWLWHVA